jgi:hypothetical protein
VKRWLVVLLAIVALAIVACRKPRWGEKVASELHVAGITIAIPAGWRSMAELSAGQPEGKLAPDTVGMMPEIDRAGVVTATVLVTTRRLADVRPWNTCDEAVAYARGHDSPPISDVHDGGAACTWHVKMGRVNGVIGLRKIGETEVSLQCLLDAAGDPDAQRVCDQVIATLQMR